MLLTASITYLGKFEEIVLLTVAVLQTDAYGVTIAAELNRRTERTVSLFIQQTITISLTIFC
jgi:uncharacterized protein YueI